MSWFRLYLYKKRNSKRFETEVQPLSYPIHKFLEKTLYSEDHSQKDYINKSSKLYGIYVFINNLFSFPQSSLIYKFSNLILVRFLRCWIFSGRSTHRENEFGSLLSSIFAIAYFYCNFCPTGNSISFHRPPVRKRTIYQDIDLVSWLLIDNLRAFCYHNLKHMFFVFCDVKFTKLLVCLL